MQTPRIYAPDEVISLALPARMVQLVLDIFHKNPNLGLPFDVIAEVLVEVEAQCQRQPSPPPQLPSEPMARQPVEAPRGNSYDRA